MTLVEMTGRSETQRATENRGTGQMGLARLEHDSLVERVTTRMMILAGEDSQQNGPWGDFHDDYVPFYAVEHRLEAAQGEWLSGTDEPLPSRSGDDSKRRSNISFVHPCCDREDSDVGIKKLLR